MHNINPSIQNTIKAQNAIVPNIIHSLDANHLSNIITKFRSENKGLFTIHDCFLINPNDYDFLYNSVLLLPNLLIFILKKILLKNFMINLSY